MSCFATHFSITLDTKHKFEIGLKFLNSSGLKDCFLRSGLTLATLRSIGSIPDSIERLTILTITELILAKHSFIIQPGRGSKSQDFKYIDPTIALSSVNETFAKVVNWHPAATSLNSRPLSGIDRSRSSRIFLILLPKKRNKILY